MAYRVAKPQHYNYSYSQEGVLVRCARLIECMLCLCHDSIGFTDGSMTRPCTQVAVNCMASDLEIASVALMNAATVDPRYVDNLVPCMV